MNLDHLTPAEQEQVEPRRKLYARIARAEREEEQGVKEEDYEEIL